MAAPDTAQRPLTVGELIDYLSQFPPEASVFLTASDPSDEREVNRHEDEGLAYIVMEQIDYYVESSDK